MVASHAEYRVPPSQMDDVPIVRRSENLATSKLRYVKSSEKSGIRWFNSKNHSEFFMHYKKTILAAILSFIALLLFGTLLINMSLQSAVNSAPLQIERIREEKSTTEHNIFHNNDEREIYEREEPIDRHLYGIISEYLANPKKPEIRQIQKRQAPETTELKNDPSYSIGTMTLHRVGTGSKIPREIEIIPDHKLYSKEIHKNSDKKLKNDKRDIEKNEMMRVCKRSVEHCKSVLNSMQSLVKITGENVDSLNKLMNQIKINDETKKADPHNFQELLQCIQCEKITDTASMTFPDDSEQYDETANDNHPLFKNRHLQTTNTLTIADMLDNRSSKVVDSTEKIFKIEETKSLSVVSESPISSKDTITSESSVKKTVDHSIRQNMTDGVEVTNELKNMTFIKQQQEPKRGSTKVISKVQSALVNFAHTEISTNPSLELTSPTPLHEQSTVKDSTDFDFPTGPSAISNFPVIGDFTGWAETTKTQAIVEESSSYRPMTSVRGKSYKSQNQEDVSRMAAFDPRIMMGPQYQPSKGIYDGSSPTLPTAETTKTSQQVQYTPPLSWMPYPVCFFGSPSSGMPSGPPQKQSMPGMMTFPASSPGTGVFPFPVNPYPQRGYGYPGQKPAMMSQELGPMQYHRQQGTQFGIGQNFPYGNPPMETQGPHSGPMTLGAQGFHPNFGNPPTGPGSPGRSQYYCTYMPAPTYQFPSVPGVSEFQRNVENPQEEVAKGENSYDPMWTMPKTIDPKYAVKCAPNQKSCDDGSRCVPINSWCNGRVDCPDASDETKCSCRDRVNNDRICDGYFDCPHGEDELGCFGCPQNSFSCSDSINNDAKGNCVPLFQRCDGLRQCPNGKDEMDCSILTQTYFENRDMFTVGYTTGYLHKNWQGRWYPVCTPSESWAREACLAETGFQFRESPLMTIESTPPGDNSVSYLVQLINGEIRIVPSCNDKAIYVKCHEVPCGTRILSQQEKDSQYDRHVDSLLGSAKNVTNLKNATSNVDQKIINQTKKLSEKIDKVLNGSKHFEDTNGTNETEEIVGAEWRVVGGKASQPKAWPFLVAIRKDGYFTCGGVIINEDWILTAAHCVDGFVAHYYEIQAGLLRRFSFSPMAQTRRARYIKMHPSYQREIMKNDLALIRLDEPLLFNRWIRPTCLPKSWRTETSTLKEPLPDTTCVTAGWGAVFEAGPDPDHLREVEIPITRECKHPEDQNDAEICAGIPQGGRDACQGDSGGPLMCRYPDSDSQWYVAGIVSHGEGCARPNEPGAYTKVSRFVDWINDIILHSNNLMLGPRPRKLCPGFSCEGGLGKCLPSRVRCDRVVNCFDAEDEINCRYRVFKEFNDSEIVGQMTPELRRENVTKNEPMEFSENKNKTDASHKGSTMVVNVNSTTESTVEPSATPSTTVKNYSTTISMNVTDFQQLTTTTIKPQSSTQKYKEIMRFTCTRLIQSLPIGKRCNRVIDCEDGTDENNCTCKDYLANLYPKAICNGYVDCHDGSDEENCSFCRDNEFTCSRSGTCIPRIKICDHNIDCDNMEDELDCFALSNGDYVILDLDKRPHLNLEGVVSEWNNRTWRPLCVKHSQTDLARLSNEVCMYWGFGGAESFKEIQVRDSPMDIKQSTKNYTLGYEYSIPYVLPENNENTCEGIYVRCKPVLAANTSNLIITNPLNDNIDYLWPWQASIFVNGLYHCPAILLEPSWLLATSRCVQNLDLTGNYTTALVGMAPTYRYVDSPYQQISHVDSIKIVKKFDVALLHLKHPVNTTRYVQPIFVEKKILPATTNDVCAATGVDEKYRTETTFLRPVIEHCPVCHRCYKNDTFDDCKNKTSNNWSGTIVCRGSGAWYPAAIFHEIDMLCGFQSVQTLTSIDYGNAHFTEIMEENVRPIAGPYCDGVRCSLGNCISWNKVCDGIDDCRDGWDERASHCRTSKELCESTGGIGCKCSKSELRCANGQCVPKEAFCNFKIDCDDGSDETPSCTCADYLKLTAPDRLCNNVRDCLDKSDENNEDCYCKDASFKCSGGLNVTETCVSQDFVCDGEPDCPNGEDEKICRTIKGALRDPSGTGQVLRRSFGVWHSECFSLPLETTKEVSNLCRSMGYKSGEALKFKNNKNPYGPALIPERDDFYMIRMNRQTWITMRDNRPLVNLVIAKEPCHRAFVRCS